MDFISPSKGRMSLKEVFADIMDYVHSEPEAKYRLIIGTDSQSRDNTCFVTAIIIYREGKGARYYYHRDNELYVNSLRQRIYYETARSLGVASKLADYLAQNGHEEVDIEIHLDVGETGKTKELIREVVGMVVGSGFDARIKPDSYGATKVADKYTK
ncbi:MAG: ribonuclease H-like YkuK family protein [Limnochordia bacterium]|jgi:predicted RNase H-related nuclease YkuK (DUF458 family)